MIRCSFARFGEHLLFFSHPVCRWPLQAVRLSLSLDSTRQRRLLPIAVGQWHVHNKRPRYPAPIRLRCRLTIIRRYRTVTYAKSRRIWVYLRRAGGLLRRRARISRCRREPRSIPPRTPARSWSSRPCMFRNLEVSIDMARCIVNVDRTTVFFNRRMIIAEQSALSNQIANFNTPEYDVVHPITFARLTKILSTHLRDDFCIFHDREAALDAARFALPREHTCY